VQLRPPFEPTQALLARLFRKERSFTTSGCLLRRALLPAWRETPPGLRELSCRRGRGRRRRAPAPPPMPRWRPGVVGGPSPLRTLPSARLARFCRPNRAFDGRRLEFAVRAELAQGREARAQCCSSLPLDPRLLHLSHNSRAAPLCA
jgi:hypothetical protein